MDESPKVLKMIMLIILSILIMLIIMIKMLILIMMLILNTFGDSLTRSVFYIL